MPNVDFQQIADNLSNKLKKDPSAFSHYSTDAGFVAGVESFSPEAEANLNRTSQSFMNTIEGLEGYEDATAAQKLAAQHILTAAGGGKLLDHAMNSMSFDPAHDGDHAVGPVNSEAIVAGTESFSEEKLGDTVGHSMMFNFAASKQSDFAEGFYPTYVVPANKAGYKMHIRRTVVFRELTFNDDGRPVDFKEESLLYAETRPEILENEYTNVHPVVTPESEAKFVPANIEQNEVLRIGEAEIATRALRVGQELNIMGLSRYPGMIGEFDHTDVLDPNMRIKRLTFSVKTNNGSTDDLDVFRMDTTNHQFSAFEAVNEGNTRTMRANYKTDYTLNKNTKVNGSVANLVANLGLTGTELNVVLKMRVNVEIDLNTNNIDISGGEIRLDRVTRDGEELAVSDATYIDIAAKLANGLNVEGIAFKMFRTNQNERERGVMIGSRSFSLQFLIAPGSPFSNIRPKGANEGDADLNDLIIAVRAKANADAHKELMNHREECRALHAKELSISSTRLPGIHYLDQPWFESEILDLSDVTNISEHEMSADIKAKIIDKIRRMTYRVEAKTGYRNGMEALGINGKPELLIGTTTEVEQHMIVEGDARTASIAFETRTVTSRNPIMRTMVEVNGEMMEAHRMVMAFVPKTDKPCPLQPGVHMWMSEQVTKATLTRRGATNNELTVTPRNHHFNLCPIYMELLIVGLQ